MKRLTIVALAASLLAVALFAVSASESRAGYPPEPGSPFVGAWESRDIDGSYQRLSISEAAIAIGMGTPPDPQHQIVYFDHSRTTCEGAAIAIGMSTPPDPMMPNTLEAEVSGWCLKSHRALDGETLTLTYAPDGDYLMQEVAGGVIFWKRQAANMGPPVQPSPS